jgi:NADH:ubiquinone oxidoreductase subunit C
MSREELKSYLTETFPSFKVEDTFDFPLLWVPKEEIVGVLTKLKKDDATQLNFLMCQTAVDRKTYFEVVYHLHSYPLKHDMVVKVQLDDRDNAEVDSIVSLWAGAEFYENEMYDLFGIRFNGHPHLRRFMLGDEWPGFPLRKDYTDEHMISL